MLTISHQKTDQRRIPELFRPSAELVKIICYHGEHGSIKQESALFISIIYGSFIHD